MLEWRLGSLNKREIRSHLVEENLHPLQVTLQLLNLGSIGRSSFCLSGGLLRLRSLFGQHWRIFAAEGNAQDGDRREVKKGRGRSFHERFSFQEACEIRRLATTAQGNLSGHTVSMLVCSGVHHVCQGIPISMKNKINGGDPFQFSYQDSIHNTQLIHTKQLDSDACDGVGVAS